MSDPIQVSQLAAESINKRRSFWSNAVYHIWHDRLTLLALVILFLLTLACFVAPPIVEEVLHVDVEDASVRDRYLPPSPEHILGTDQLGRDQLIRLLYGGRISLLIAYSASLLSMTIGVVVGLVAGYFGGIIDDVVTWFISTLSSIPSLFLLLIASAVFSPSATVLVMILGLLGWVQMARLVRGQILSLKQQDFVLAARALGSSHLHIMLYHILPNVLSIALISVTISAGNLILTESGLSFLGLGVQPPTPTWGNMLSDSRSYFAQGIHLVVWPGSLITITVLCSFLLGDGLRDALDPRSRK
ncbi:ABC transporter permease [Phototrophicus methaneseepsis]|uniref:ABC transporter permease n=1 Tax=Phototrophicus methaneseepsis TaxID=2710758 RepID=A0A7S8ECX3_9CHLR|nr:ABC transporter permease [Phototrophicus methaneseepsis]QPC84624.1 ABC transporter permease [Phototrophicus methaneseepsis]